MARGLRSAGPDHDDLPPTAAWEWPFVILMMPFVALPRVARAAWSTAGSIARRLARTSHLATRLVRHALSFAGAALLEDAEWVAHVAMKLLRAAAGRLGSWARTADRLVRRVGRAVRRVRTRAQVLVRRAMGEGI